MAGSVTLSPKSKSSILNDVKQLMHSYGDVSEPLPETVELVLSIVRQQMYCLICQAADVANSRGLSTISEEEIIFLFRRNTVKLQRLLSYVKSKDLRSQISREISSSDTIAAEYAISKGKREQSYELFVSRIDSTGRLSAALEGTEPDPSRIRRLTRQDIMTRTMDDKQYHKFHEARQTNLGRRIKIQKFRDWLLGEIEKLYKLSASAIEILSFCAHETIAEIVDLALVIKKDVKSSTDPIDRLLPFSLPERSDWLSQRKAPTPEVNPVKLFAGQVSPPVTNDAERTSMETALAITPDNVREVMRRYYEKNTKFSSKESHSLLCA